MEGGLRRQTRRAFLQQVISQYCKASTVKKKSKLLDAFTAATGYNPKYAMWLLNHAGEGQSTPQSPRPRHYGPEVQHAGPSHGFHPGRQSDVPLALCPLDELGDHYLFSAHMLQHLMMVGPPLLLLGTPGWLIEPPLGRRFVLRPGKALTHPFLAFTLFDQTLHILEHLSFVLFGLLCWWPMFK